MIIPPTLRENISMLSSSSSSFFPFSYFLLLIVIQEMKQASFKAGTIKPLGCWQLLREVL
jgi:hypothetical protein